MFRNIPVQRSIASLVLVTFSSLTLYPCAVSAQVHTASDQANSLLKARNSGALGGLSTKFPALASSASTTAATKQSSSEERLSQLLKQIQDEVKTVAPVANTAAKVTTKPGMLLLTAATNSNTTLVNQHVSNIRSANTQIKTIYSDIDQSFKDTEQHLKDAKLPAKILARYSKAVADYQSRQAEFNKIMGRIDQADDKGQTSDRQTALSDLSSFMDKYPNAKPHQFTDPNKLPFGSPSNKVRKPNDNTTKTAQGIMPPPPGNKATLTAQASSTQQLTQTSLPDLPNAQRTSVPQKMYN